MIQLIRNWRADRRAASFEKAWVEGYSWAAGKLLAHPREPGPVQAELDSIAWPGEGDMPFDLGAQAAIDDWNRVILPHLRASPI